MLVRRLAANSEGRDTLVGDVHGSFGLVVQGLKRMRFDPKKDRLFSVGDTVDRGPESRRAAKFLATPWVHAVRGNHEDMFLQLYADGDAPPEAAVEFVTGRNGMEWWRELPQPDRMEMIAVFRALPVAIEIETRRGKVGVVHAEVPRGMDWATFLDRVEAGDEEVIQHALWSRKRISAGDDSGVPGVGRVFCGHTPLGHAQRLGNVYYVDTGAVFGLAADDPLRGRLTMTEITCGTAVYTRSEINGMLDMRTEKGPDQAFGDYARPL